MILFVRLQLLIKFFNDIFHLLIHAIWERIIGRFFSYRYESSNQTCGLTAGKSGAKSLLVLWHHREYEKAQILLHRLPTATPASTQYSNRIAPGSQYPLCYILFYRIFTGA